MNHSEYTEALSGKSFFIVLPQIAASLGLGTIMSAFLGNNTMLAILLGGVSMLIAAACVQLVDVTAEDELEASKYA